MLTVSVICATYYNTIIYTKKTTLIKTFFYLKNKIVLIGIVFAVLNLRNYKVLKYINIVYGVVFITSGDVKIVFASGLYEIIKLLLLELLT